MATSKPAKIEMSALQVLNHAIRNGAPVSVIIKHCRGILDGVLNNDAAHGPAATANSSDVDAALSLWGMATQLGALARENETLKRRLRRDRQRATSGAQSNLLKKTPEKNTFSGLIAEHLRAVAPPEENS